MKAFLMCRDRDFDLQLKLPSRDRAAIQDLESNTPFNRQLPAEESLQNDLTQDLELNTLFNAMALGDKFLFEVAKHAVLSGLNNDVDTIHYRQNVLNDCLKNAAVVREIYAIAVEAIESEKKHYLSFFSRSPGWILHRSIDVLKMFVAQLKKLTAIADQHAGSFDSEGFTAFFATLKNELDDAYFASVQDHLRTLEFRSGVLISSGLGKGNKGTDYVLRKPNDNKQTWMKRMFAQKQPAYTFRLHPRDESGPRYLSDLKDRGINPAANALAQSTDHILSFFSMLRTQLAFYVGCLNLHAQLAQKGEPLCFPVPIPTHERRHSFSGLYDVCLTLNLEPRLVGNSVNADHKDLVIITGANRGGKSTLLRSIGLAQLMMQCGMFAPAESFTANVCDRLFTHYKREEDASMKSGKFDEELSRMSAIVDHITPNSMLLFNESFGGTNEREGSEIARQIVTALLEMRVKMFFVTHLYEFANGFCHRKTGKVIFLRAERQADGTRTFKLIEGEPLQTSYGEDLYHRIFATDTRP